MPSATPHPPSLPKWDQPPPTTCSLTWANLRTIDLGTFSSSPAARQTLANQLRDAVHRDGFFAVTGTGLAESEIKRQYEIGQAFFNLPMEVKGAPQYRCDFGAGNYFGFRGAEDKKVMSTDVRENVESMNVPKFVKGLEGEVRHPFFEPYEREMEDFSRVSPNHNNFLASCLLPLSSTWHVSLTLTGMPTQKALDIAHKILTLFAIILELPESYFVSRHPYSQKSEDHLRYMIYRPRSASDDAKVSNTWARSHTDFGSLTLLWSQSVAGLQIKTYPSGEWKYVAPVGSGVDGIVCNVGDALDFWSAGYFKSTVHRVVRPPPDQDHIHRLGLFYFVRPGDETEICPAPSPLLKRLGLIGEKEAQGDVKPVKGIEYVRARVKNYHDHSDYKDMTGKKFRVGNLEIDDQLA
jgi:isopenicillin N synthase-like dioxygenase